MVRKFIFIILMLQSINLLAVDYLVITPMEFLGNPKLNELISTRQESLSVMGVVYEDYADIKAEIISQYQTGLKYVLIVGDDSYIPCVSESDNYYACMDGDNIPDIAIGRFPCSSATELGYMVDKALRYENTHGAWVNNMIYVGGTTNNPYSEMDWSKREYLRQYIIEYVNSKSRLTQRINEGIGLIIYGGNSSYTAWEYLNTDDLYRLNNLLNPIVFSVSAYSGSLTHYSLLQSLMENPCGSVATIGCAVDTGYSQLIVPFCSVLGNKPQRLGDLFLDWEQRLQRQSREIETYSLFGDPAMALPKASTKRSVVGYRRYAQIKSN